MLEALQTTNKVIGIKQSTHSVESGIAAHAFVASDADDKVKLPFLSLCSQRNIPVTYINTTKELGTACGIDVGAAVAVILK